jgi:hypothetical protein
VPQLETGSLAECPLGPLLSDLAGRSLTGIVHLDGDVRRIICFRDGRVYLAMSSPGPSLQRVLIDSGAVDDAGWTAALDLAGEHGSVVRSLLATGARRETVGAAIRELTMGTLLELLVPDDNGFRIAEGETHRLGSDITFSVEDLLEDADRRLRRWGASKDALPSMDTVLRRAPRLPMGRDSVELDRVQWRIVDALDEPLTLAALIERIGLGAFGIFDELHHLLGEGVVRSGADATSAE